MELDKIARILILIHATFGGIALVAGGVAIFAKKGLFLHKKSGLLFYYTMLISAVVALIISFLPNHANAFLFSIGLFSLYFLISGYRSLRFKRKEFDLTVDKFIAIVVLITGIMMMLYPLIFYHVINIVLSVFGSICIIFGIRDLTLFRDKEKASRAWLKLHLGKMTGGYIAAVSAFCVVNNILPGIWNWFVPGIIGSVFINYWMFKLNKSNG